MKSTCVYCRHITTRAGKYTFLCSSCENPKKNPLEEKQIFLDGFMGKANIAQ